MNINIIKGGDDFFTNRLFSYLSRELNLKIEGIKQLRGNVFLIKSDQSKFILKGFNDLRKLKIQETFSSSLRKSGFNHSYRFHSFSDQPLYFANQYYGCMEYIEPHKKPFHYKHSSDRLEGINLLENFHAKTQNLSHSYSTLLPKTDLVSKWRQRKNEFTHNMPRLNYHISKEVGDELISWADFSLTGFTRLKKSLESSKPVILHGDVAHHNFLRSREGKLNLIDFDLISIGSSSCDMLQYANRILPFLNWRLDLLSEIPHLSNWLNNDSFLFGLLYPADILREWNRLFREESGFNFYRTAPIIELTINQIHQRRQFQEEVKSLL
ncbi:MAG TPA: aminoglycoside phosphotransferase [Bacillus bacterium]|nr:aminoglycoside phosphotransferase [Bacillus sp. (in: firmicutes)]